MAEVEPGWQHRTGSLPVWRARRESLSKALERLEGAAALPASPRQLPGSQTPAAAGRTSFTDEQAGPEGEGATQRGRAGRGPGPQAAGA